MFTENSETKLELFDDGRINVTIITHYLKDGVEIGQDNWGCCLEPHPEMCIRDRCRPSNG